MTKIRKFINCSLDRYETLFECAFYVYDFVIYSKIYLFIMFIEHSTPVNNR
jgi:hypothetical protein